MLEGGCSGNQLISVPGGYVIWILMEKQSWVDLSDFFELGKYSLEER